MVDPSGFAAELAWARLQMRRLRAATEALPDLTGLRMACCSHLDLKMIPAFEGLARRGAHLYITTCNPYTVRPEVVAHLSAFAQVDADYAMSEEDRQASLGRALHWSPTHLLEIGGELSRIWHQRGSFAPVRGSVEATSAGLQVLSQLSLAYPVFDLNSIAVKENIHNRRMVGLSTWHAFFDRTHLTLHEKRVVIFGFGPVGRSLADAARAYGGLVTVVEQDAGRALEARYAGWDTANRDEAVAVGDVFVTATSAAGVLGLPEFRRMKDGAFLMNVGHRADEIDTAALMAFSHRELLPYIEEVDVDRRKLYLFAGGSMANLTAGQGDSLNAFDLTLAVFLVTIGFLVHRGHTFAPGLYPVPTEVWEPACR
jgi:adenosylhomocysteinase